MHYGKEQNSKSRESLSLCPLVNKLLFLLIPHRRKLHTAARTLELEYLHPCGPLFACSKCWPEPYLCFNTFSCYFFFCETVWILSSVPWIRGQEPGNTWPRCLTEDQDRIPRMAEQTASCSSPCEWILCKAGAVSSLQLCWSIMWVIRKWLSQPTGCIHLSGRVKIKNSILIYFFWNSPFWVSLIRHFMARLALSWVAKMDLPCA